MKISSPAFKNNEHIPSLHTCDGKNISPPLTFGEIPKNTKSLALIVDDPDAPSKTWVHWVLFNIPPTTPQIDIDSCPENAAIGTTDFRETKYGGPCPPTGTHRYFFKLYAFDSMLDLPAGATKKQVEEAMKNHILAQAELIGLYSRQ